MIIWNTFFFGIAALGAIGLALFITKAIVTPTPDGSKQLFNFPLMAISGAGLFICYLFGLFSIIEHHDAIVEGKSKPVQYELVQEPLYRQVK